MISAHRTHRHFNIEKTLLVTDKERDRLRAAMRNGKLIELPRRPRFRGWAIRLNDRIEHWMDTVDWRKWDIWAGNVCGFFLTGFILYFLFIVADAMVRRMAERMAH
jgi:hypothetical protein